jgi:hypothetical protein
MNASEIPAAWSALQGCQQTRISTNEKDLLIADRALPRFRDTIVNWDAFRESLIKSSTTVGGRVCPIAVQGKLHLVVLKRGHRE